MYGKLIKDLVIVITQYLSLIFNKSLLTGIFPSDWKKARVSLYINVVRGMNVRTTV